MFGRGVDLGRVLINASGPDIRLRGIIGHRKAALNRSKMTRSGHRSDRNLAWRQAAGPRVCRPPRRRAFGLSCRGGARSFSARSPTADGRCRTGCCTPPHWLFAVSVFVSTGAATAPRWETIMANSKTIAGLIGPSLIALAAALLINLGSMSALVEARRRLKSARIGWPKTGDPAR